jgi:hypothetical protein
MDMQYIYPAGANNGRVSRTIDGVTGETVDYTYDVLNRLTQAQTEGSGGVQLGQSYTYDSIGNMTAKGVTKGSAPTFSTTINPATNGGPTSFTTPPSGDSGMSFKRSSIGVRSSSKCPAARPGQLLDKGLTKTGQAPDKDRTPRAPHRSQKT